MSWTLSLASKWLLRLALVSLVPTILGCGGGEPSADGRPTAGRVSAPSSLSANAEEGPTVIGVVKVGERRISRTVFEYQFSVTLKGGDEPLVEVVADLVAVGSGSTIVQGRVTAPELAAGATVAATGTVLIRHDRTVAFDAAALRWTVSGVPAEGPIVPGAQLSGGLYGPALLGTTHGGKINVIPFDRRNSVLALGIANPTAAGAAPSVAPTGEIQWQPNEADFQSTTTLRVTADLAVGGRVEFIVPVKVVAERVVHQEALPPAGGPVGDPKGRYLIVVQPRQAGQVLSGSVSIVEKYDAAGRFTFAIRFGEDVDATVKVVDAPVLTPAGSSAPVAQPVRASALRGSTRDGTRPLRNGTQSTQTSSTPYYLNIGWRLGDFAGPGQFANSGQVNVYTTRNEVFVYEQVIGGTLEHQSSQPDEPVFQIDGSCSSPDVCRAFTRPPVLLVHGFRLKQEPSGGTDTWGDLAQTLHDRGHPVFELRWNTYMRFEEAAGLLARLARRIAELTGHKVNVVAHSFGGIVAHQAALGQGIRFTGEGWITVPTGGVFDRLITLGSPLSGIAASADGTLGLTEGKDDDDPTIQGCEAITCFQAGSSAWWGPFERAQLRRKIGALDVALTGLSEGTAGQSIRRLHAARGAFASNDFAFTTVISLKYRPLSDYIPDLTESTAYELGDGLISLMGQAVSPYDFATDPFSQDNEDFGVLRRFGSDFLEELDSKFAGNTEQRLVNGREYFFALRASHSALQNRPETYRIANYPADGRVAVAISRNGIGNGLQGDHPLKFFIESPSYLGGSAKPYDLAGLPRVNAVARGVLIKDGRPVEDDLTLQLERRSDGQKVSDAIPVRSDASTGRFEVDVGAVLSDLFPGMSTDVRSFALVLRAGDGDKTGAVVLRRELVPELDYGTVDISLMPSGTGSPVSGVLRDGSTGATILGASVYLMKGEGRSKQELLWARSLAVSDVVTTDVNGRFTTGALDPGRYSALVSKPGYDELLIPALDLPSGQTVQWTLIRSGSGGAVFFDEFEGATLDPLKWTASLGPGGISVAGGEVTLGAGSFASTAVSRVFSGTRIIIEFTFAGRKPSGRDTNVYLIDVDSGEQIGVGDTNYWGWGLYLLGTGRYNLLGPNLSRGAPTGGINMETNGLTTTATKYARVTIDGQNVVVERGDSPESLNERLSRTLGASIVGRSFYLRIGTGANDGFYSPGTFGFISVETQ